MTDSVTPEMVATLSSSGQTIALEPGTASPKTDGATLSETPPLTAVRDGDNQNIDLPVDE